MNNLAHAAHLPHEVGGAFNFALPLRGAAGPPTSTPERNAIKCEMFPSLRATRAQLYVFCPLAPPAALRLRYLAPEF